MLGYVGERFLGDPVQCLQGSAVGRALVSRDVVMETHGRTGFPLPLKSQVAQRHREIRTERDALVPALRNRAEFLTESVQQPPHLRKCNAPLRVGETLLECRETQGQTDEILPGMVVQVPRNPPALSLDSDLYSIKGHVRASLGLACAASRIGLVRLLMEGTACRFGTAISRGSPQIAITTDIDYR